MYRDKVRGFIVKIYIDFFVSVLIDFVMDGLIFFCMVVVFVKGFGKFIEGKGCIVGGRRYMRIDWKIILNVLF